MLVNEVLEEKELNMRVVSIDDIDEMHCNINMDDDEIIQIDDGGVNVLDVDDIIKEIEVFYGI